MAAVTLLGTVTFNTTAGSKTVTATPAVGDLIVIITAHSGNTSTSATPPTDNNSDGLGVYALATSALKNASADVMCVWVRRNKIGSATSTVFTHNPGTTTGGGLGVMKVTGMSLVSLLAAIRSGASSNQASGGTPSLSLGAAANTNNAIIGAVFSGTNSTTTVANNASYTEVFDNGYATPTSGLEIMTRNSGETGSSIAWGGTVASAFCAVAIELDVSVPAASSTLTDNFDDNSRDTSKWNSAGFYETNASSGTASETNQRLEATPTASTVCATGYVSTSAYNLTDSAIYVRVSNVAAFSSGEIAYLSHGPDDNNYYTWLVGAGGLIIARRRVAGVNTDLLNTSYSSATHAWFRIRHQSSDNTIHFETATSSASDPPAPGDWTDRASETVSASIPITGGKIAIGAALFTADASPGAAVMDGFNTATTSSSSGSATGSGTATAVPIISGAAVRAGTATGKSQSIGSASGVGAASAIPTVKGAAAGVGAASGAGQTTANGAGAAAGVGAASAVGSTVVVAVGNASGSGSASATAIVNGAAAGVGAASGAGSTAVRGAGSAAGAGSASSAPIVKGAAAGAGSASAVPIVKGAASGAGNAVGFSPGITSAVGAASGSGAAAAGGQAAVQANGAASGSGAAAAGGQATVRADGSSSGAGSAQAGGGAIITADGAASGYGTATGAGGILTISFGHVKLSMGMGYVVKPAKVWDGATWVEKPVKVSRAGAWVATSY